MVNLHRSILFLILFVQITRAFHSAGFSSTSYVITANKEIKGISEVQVGDELLYIDQNRQMVADKVIAVLIDDLNAEESFLSIKMMTGETIDIKPKQLVYQMGGGMIYANKFAKEVKVGDSLLVLNKHLISEVAQIGLVKRRGVHLPLTESGFIYVNGVLASCYSMHKASSLQGTLFGYFRKGVDLLPEWLQVYSSFQIGNKHWSQYIYESVIASYF